MGPGSARVHVLYTGGTIGMAPRDPAKPGSPLEPKPLSELLPYVPALLRDSRFELSYESMDPPLDSSHLGPEHWIEMAARIERVYAEKDGFVILHGTDTMAYTASALAFLFENLAKPVVLTGSQLPISGARTDAIMNIVNAVHVAGYKAAGLPCVPEVVIVFADKILRGCRARKVSTVSWAAFDSPNFPPLGRIGEQIRIATHLLRPRPGPDMPFRTDRDWNTRVVDIGLTPGFRPTHLRHILLGLDDIDAIVLRTYGAGNAPGRPDFLDVIEEVRRRGKTILSVTQCQEGSVEMGLYAASAGLLERGVISGLDLTPEAALTKLMWTLGTESGAAAAARLQVNQRGEQSLNLFDLRYGACDPRPAFTRAVTPDVQFDAARLDRAVVRFSGLGFAAGPSRLRVFANLASATWETDESHPACLAEVDAPWEGKPLELAVRLDRVKARAAIGGAVELTVVGAEPGTRFWFDGLSLALFALA